MGTDRELTIYEWCLMGEVHPVLLVYLSLLVNCVTRKIFKEAFEGAKKCWPKKLKLPLEHHNESNQYLSI